MQEQAGIYRITLYEAKGLSITYADAQTIKSITNIGATITLENSDCNTMELGYNFEHRRSGNNKLTYKNAITWKQIGLNNSNLDLINILKQSIYGWVPVLEFYNNSQKIIENPFKFVDSSIDNNVSNHYNIQLQNIIFGKRIKDYTPVTATSGFISTDVPGGNIPDGTIPDGSETIKLN